MGTLGKDQPYQLDAGARRPRLSLGFSSPLSLRPPSSLTVSESASSFVKCKTAARLYAGALVRPPACAGGPLSTGILGERCPPPGRCHPRSPQRFPTRGQVHQEIALSCLHLEPWAEALSAGVRDNTNSRGESTRTLALQQCTQCGPGGPGRGWALWGAGQGGALGGHHVHSPQE